LKNYFETTEVHRSTIALPYIVRQLRHKIARLDP